MDFYPLHLEIVPVIITAELNWVLQNCGGKMSHFKTVSTYDIPNIPGVIFPTRPNSLPEPAIEITLEEYLWEKNRINFILMGMGYDQVFLPDLEEHSYMRNFWSVNYEWYPDMGFAIASRHTTWEKYVQCKNVFDNSGDKNLIDFVTGRGIFVHDPLTMRSEILSGDYGFAHRWFRIGCHHNLTEENPRMFEHIYTCKKCGYRYTTDSSG